MWSSFLMIALIQKSLSANRKLLLVRLVWVIVPIIIGTVMYVKGRKVPVLFERWLLYNSKETSSFPGSIWIPDYLWCVSLWMAMVMVWDGWDRIPMSWKIGIVLMVSATELFQWLGWLHGTGDWIDVCMYQMAILTVYILHKTKRI
jgi:hypothetical protein